MALLCEEVRQTVISLHNQGIFPSWEKVKSEVSNPKVMRMLEVWKAWHAARKDLGIEQ